MEKGGGARRPACDNCNQRKTKCDRGSPCSSCIAGGLDCRINRRATERRQRILVSARYDEAMENVDRSLQEVSSALQRLLVINNNNNDNQSQTPSAHPAPDIGTVAGGNSPAEAPINGFRGDSSFTAHVKRVGEALRDAASNLESHAAATSIASVASQMMQNADLTEPDAGTMDASPVKMQYPELQCKPLPPLRHVLSLLRLAREEPQRLFIDIPVVNIAELGELCQSVYFAVDDYSIFTWATVNVCLYFLFFDLSSRLYARVGVGDADVQTYACTLTDNIDSVVASLRLCEEPSVEACQAFELLTTFCVKRGRSAVSWSLAAAASRMCIDLGLHRLPRTSSNPDDLLLKKRVFWNAFIRDTNMAFTLGRTPTMHQYDVATARLSASEVEAMGFPMYLHDGFLEATLIMGDMYIELFSVSAGRVPLQGRVQRAEALATRLKGILSSVEQRDASHPGEDPVRLIACDLLDIIVSCLVTIAYRVVPCQDPSASSLQCNWNCVEAAREALTSLVRSGEMLQNLKPQSWIYFLSALFSMVPFACYVVLAGNTVASGSAEDLDLLSTVLGVLEPYSASSPSGTKLVEVCRAFHHIASFFVAQRAALTSSQAPSTALGTPIGTDQGQAASQEIQDDIVVRGGYEHTMGPRDWEDLTGELDLDVSAAAMAYYLEPYIPYDAAPQ